MSDVPVVSVERMSGDAPYEDVVPHCEDYLSCAHIERLLRARMAALDPPIVVLADGVGGKRWGVQFHVENCDKAVVPSGFLDHMIAQICERISATCVVPIFALEVLKEIDTAMSRAIFHVTYKSSE